MLAPRPAIAADATDDVTLTGNALTDKKLFDIRAQFLDDTDELMAYSHWVGNGCSCPGIPIEDVDIGATNRSLCNPDLDFTRPHFGYGHVF